MVLNVETVLYVKGIQLLVLVLLFCALILVQTCSVPLPLTIDQILLWQNVSQSEFHNLVAPARELRFVDQISNVLFSSLKQTSRFKAEAEAEAEATPTCFQVFNVEYGFDKLVLNQAATKN